MISSLFSKKEKRTIEWIPLTEMSTLDEIDQISQNRPVLIFKHSTRCAISSMVLNKFENSCGNQSGFEMYFLDVIARRDISNEIEVKYGILHQSPQVILVWKGKAIYDESHTGISFVEVERIAENAQ